MGGLMALQCGQPGDDDHGDDDHGDDDHGDDDHGHDHVDDNGCTCINGTALRLPHFLTQIPIMIC